MIKVILILVVLFPILIPVLPARNFWDRAFNEWKQDEVRKMLTNSPWAGQHVFTRSVMRSGLGGTAGVFESGGIGGEKEAFDVYTVCFFSAPPVRQAYVRLLQLRGNYDQLPEEQKRQFDAQTSGFLAAGQTDIIVALEFSSNDQSMTMNVQRKLNSMTAPQLQGMVYLSTESHKEIPLKAYFPPGEDGTGAKFIFPRNLDGKPVASSRDKEIKFSLEMPDLGHRVFVKWKLKDMVYRGQPVF